MKIVYKIASVTLAALTAFSAFSACSKSSGSDPDANITISRYYIQDELTGKKKGEKTEEKHLETGDSVSFDIDNSANTFTVTDLTDEEMSFTAANEYVINVNGTDTDYGTDFSVPYGKTVTLRYELDDNTACYVVFNYGEAEEKVVDYEGKTVAVDSDGNEAVELTAQGFECDGSTGITVTYLIENKTDTALTQVSFDVSYLDADGNEIKSAKIAFVVRDYPIEPGETRECSRTQYFDGSDETESVQTDNLAYRDADSLAPYNDVVPNSTIFEFMNDEDYTSFIENYKSDMPETVTYTATGEGSTEYDDETVISGILEILKNVKIGDETTADLTDKDIMITFSMEGSKTYTFTFESNVYFDYQGKKYTIIDDAGLFSLFDEYEEEDADGDEEADDAAEDEAE